MTKQLGANYRSSEYLEDDSAYRERFGAQAASLAEGVAQLARA
ncbi:MAG TPA: hypothetical protein VFN67_07465 [Polyangiales bacterium]|nr:hypothetical protein [Polyangiales bacterium]